jgi:hypothetical protein
VSWRVLEQENRNLAGSETERMSKFVLLLEVLDATVRECEAGLNVERLWFEARRREEFDGREARLLKD